MEQFRHIGEVLGSINALMVLEEGIQINQGQCRLLHDILTLAFETIGDEIRLHLKPEERKTKWKNLDQPLRELYRVFREGEIYIRSCMETKDWWGKAITLHQNKECVEFYIHNLFCYFPAVIEAIENAGEIAGLDQDEMQKKRVLVRRKYDKEWNDPKLFQWRFAKQYLVPKAMSKRLESAWREDRWRLIEALKEKKIAGCVGGLTKNEQQLADLLLKKVQGSESVSGKLFPSSILVGSKDYHIKRRLGNGRHYKEITWLGQTFALRHFFGEIEPLSSEISGLLSLSHPNVLQHLCGFYDEDKKECFLVMEMMSKDLRCYMKENCGARRQILFSLPVVVDIMLQIARGMEYLHSKKIYHGDLNPCNIFLKARSSTEGYFQAKVSGFGLSSVQKKPSYRSSQQPKNEIDPLIWCAPEVLAEQDQSGSNSARSKYTEKADVYSFGMLCFELLTGKVPFEDSHLQGEKMSHTIRAGGRPLFPFPSPKYLVNLTKRCWHTDPSQRLGFSSISRILRYIKKFLALNPDVDQPPILQSPPMDYCEIETWFQKHYSTADSATSISQIPFQMFSYKLGELEKTPGLMRVKSMDSVSERASMCQNDASPISAIDSVTVIDDTRSVNSDLRSIYDTRSVFSEAPVKKSRTKRRSDVRTRKASGTSKAPTPPKLSLPKRPTPKLSPKFQSPKLPSQKLPQSNVSSPRSSFGRSSRVNKSTPSLSSLSPKHQTSMSRSSSCGCSSKVNRSSPPLSSMSTVHSMSKSPSSNSRPRPSGHVSDSEIH